MLKLTVIYEPAQSFVESIKCIHRFNKDVDIRLSHDKETLIVYGKDNGGRMEIQLGKTGTFYIETIED